HEGLVQWYCRASIGCRAYLCRLAGADRLRRRRGLPGRYRRGRRGRRRPHSRQASRCRSRRSARAGAHGGLDHDRGGPWPAPAGALSDECRDKGPLPGLEGRAMTFSTQSRGVYAIATTPFLDDGSLDKPSIDRLTDFYQDSGCTGITILGIMGEAPKLEPDESRAIIRQVVGRSRVPVIVGVSAPGLAAMRSLARDAMDMGAAGVMIAPTPA